MTLIEDMVEEMLGEYPETIEVYHHKGYSDVDGDNFWHRDDGYPSTPDETLDARVRWGMIEGNREFGENKIQYPAGFKQSSEIDIFFYILEDKVEEGDMVVYNGQEWNVTKKVDSIIQGRPYRHILAAKSLEA